MSTTKPVPVYRRARGEDFAAVADLMNGYHIDRLSDEERRQGFLLATFTGEQIEAMDAACGVFVAYVGDRLAGCLCSADLGAPSIPPPAKELRRFLQTETADGAKFADGCTMLYGPVCIDRAYRGHGILRGLFDRVRALAGNRFTMAVAFVSTTNPKSISVHRDGLGMTVVGEFPFAGERLTALAFPMSDHGESHE